MFRIPGKPAAAAGISVALFASSGALAAQQVPEGLAATTLSLPSGAGTVQTTPAGVVYFDGFDLRLLGQPTPLLSFGSYTFGSFTLAIGSTHVLFGESSTGDLWRVPLASGQPPQQVGNLLFNYDAVLLDDQRALVSAKASGFATPDNDVFLLDLLTSQTQLVAQIPGASGPITVDADGDVYYATAGLQFPPVPGAEQVLRFERADVEAAILGNTVLTIADADVVISGLDAAVDLAFDDDGDLFFSDYVNVAVGEIHDADGSGAALGAPLVTYTSTGLNPGGLQFVPETTATPQVFEPFQPAGGRLQVFETDYVSVAQLREVTASRPTLTSSIASPIPTGAFDLVTTGGPQQGIGLLAFAGGTTGPTIAVTLGGYEQPLLIDAGLGTAPVFVAVLFDANGAATVTIDNPGFAPAVDAVAQTVGFSLTDVLGTSTSVALTLGM